jgi:hypothetical protein
MRFVRFTPIVRVAFYPVDALRFPSLPVASRPVVVVVIDEPRR